MKIHVLKPFDLGKNLGRAYNESCSLIPDGDWICLMDYDTMFLSPNSIPLMYKYVEAYPETGLFTCYTNRIHPDNEIQNILGHPSENYDVTTWIKSAIGLEKDALMVTEIKKEISGFLMLFSKETWSKVKFNETGLCLGVDNRFSLDILKSGRNILRMDNLLVWHSYRPKDIRNKSHLI